MKYYRITVSCGHMGTKRACEKTFTIKAKDLISACKIAQSMPSVKHSKMPLATKEITYDEYKVHIKQSAYHPT